MLAVKKRGRPKTTVKPVEVDRPAQEESQEVPEANPDVKAKAAPSKRGRKPGKKAGAETGPGSSDQAGAGVPADLISEKVRGLKSLFFPRFSKEYHSGNFLTQTGAKTRRQKRSTQESEKLSLKSY